jgi:hypothetical protein
VRTAAQLWPYPLLATGICQEAYSPAQGSVLWPRQELACLIFECVFRKFSR